MTAAKQLEVDAVLEGTWRRDGDLLRVGADLLRVREYQLFRRDPYLDPIRKHAAFTQWLDEVRTRWERYQRDFG